MQWRLWCLRTNTSLQEIYLGDNEVADIGAEAMQLFAPLCSVNLRLFLYKYLSQLDINQASVQLWPLPIIIESCLTIAQYSLFGYVYICIYIYIYVRGYIYIYIVFYLCYMYLCVCAYMYIYIYIYGAVLAGPPPLWCGGGLWYCGIVVVYRIPPPLWCGGGL